jgi:hypothetical protein
MGTIQRAGGTIYIKQASPTAIVEYSTDALQWREIIWPCRIKNLSPSETTLLVILFETDITLTSTSHYFICDSEWIQIGDRCLRPNGTRPTITIKGITNYLGLINNGNIQTSADGKSNIYIYNLFVHSDSSTIDNDFIYGGGWVGQSGFALNASSNVIRNCSSDGWIYNGGGIMGSQAARLGEMIIENCSSSGNIMQGGGIVGGAAGVYGTIHIRRCYSTGNIEVGGGIVGSSAVMYNPSTMIVEDCYSLGDISTGGGIVGPFCGLNGAVSPIISRCYSRGNIQTPDSGGIIGSTYDNRVIQLQNCYSFGTIADYSGGIIVPGTSANVSHCYAANGDWKDMIANNSLQYTPNSTGYGTIWSQPNGSDRPYILSYMHSADSPYSLCPTDTAQSTIMAGEYTTGAVVSGYTHKILQINNEAPSTFSSISINESSGSIITNADTPPDDYDIYIYSTKNPYSITRYTLTVTSNMTDCCAKIPTGLPFSTRADILIGNILNTGIATPIRYASYEAYMKKRIAAASRRV